MAVSRRALLAGVFAGSGLALSSRWQQAFAANATSSLYAPPAIVVRTTENITEGRWVWLLKQASAAGVGRIYLLVKQDENNYASEATVRTLKSGEMLVPIKGGKTAEGWEDPAWLVEMLARARELGIEVHAWWPCFQDAIGAAKLPEAHYAGGGNDIFIDPARADVQAYESGLLQELLAAYPFDGVALDWVRYNARVNGSTGPLAETFKELTGTAWSEKAMETPLLRTTWDDLRARTVAEWVGKTLESQRPLHPHLAWSAFVLPWQFKEVSQSYRHLSAAGLDSLQPMIYWRDWKEDVSFTSEIISPAPFYLSERTTLDPTFDITDSKDDLANAIEFLPTDRLGRITWYQHGDWIEDNFQTVADTHAAFAEARTSLYNEPLPELLHMPLNQRLEATAFAPDASLWTLVCLGELHRRKALDGAEPIIPVLGFHRFTEGKLESGPTVWHASTAYVDAVFAFLKSSNFTVITVDTLAAYMTSEDRTLIPAQPINITIDDGSASVFTLFEPRAAAAGIPYAAALVTSWMSDGTGQTIDLGDEQSDLNLTWDEAKKLHATGRVSFISHSHEQHRYAAGGTTGTEQGPAMTTRLWIEADHRREGDSERLRRVYHDLLTSREMLATHVGARTTFLAWPYGMHDDDAEAAAMDAGFTHFFEFGGTVLAAPREKPRRIMRLAVTKQDEAVPLVFPEDRVTQQRWWLAFLKIARSTKSIDLIEAVLNQISEDYASHHEVEISHASNLVLNGHAALADRHLARLRGLYPHDGAIHAAIDDFESVYHGLM